MKTKGAQVPQSRFVRIVTLPFRALVKAKDFYVRSIINCSDRVGYGGGLGTVYAAPLPRSFSSRSSMSGESDDFAELVRAASSKSTGSKIDVDLYLQQQMVMQQATKYRGGSRKIPRSSSVAMGKIDEDQPFVFGGDINVVDIKTQMKFPRSRSYAPTNKYSSYKTSVVL